MTPLLFAVGLALWVCIGVATYQLVNYFNAWLDQKAGLMDDPEYQEYRAYLKTTWFGKDIEAWRQEQKRVQRRP